MKKTIRIMAIIAVVLAGLSLILIIASIPFQSMIARVVYGCPEEFVELLPRFPLVSFLGCFLRTACIALLIICCGNTKGEIWLELIVIGCLVIILPSINQITWMSYNELLGNMSQYLAADSVVTNIADFCSIPSDWGQALAYVTCGMSIVYKKININKKLVVINEEINL
ncbi:MAG: hypothetical protein E7387_08295 [Ruminococcaceae bacterium]|nr:hypothetical protein [Oscillospiraceae bacterium]